MFFLFLLRISKAFTFFFFAGNVENWICGSVGTWKKKENLSFSLLSLLYCAVNNASISVSTTTAKEKEKAFSPN